MQMYSTTNLPTRYFPVRESQNRMDERRVKTFTTNGHGRQACPAMRVGIRHCMRHWEPKTDNPPIQARLDAESQRRESERKTAKRMNSGTC